MAIATAPEARVYDALMRRLMAFPSLAGRPVVPQDTVYPAAGGVKAPQYLVVSYSPNTPLRTEIDPLGDNQLRGFFGVSLLTMPGQGGATELGGLLAAHFQTSPILREGTTRVRIVSRPQVAGGYMDLDRWRTPVVVEYETVSV